MKLTWQPARGNVLQYQIVYKPAEGGDRKEVVVKGDTTQAVLKNLQPATEYELFVSARYTSGVGDPLIGTGTTLEGKGACHCTDGRSLMMVGMFLLQHKCMDSARGHCWRTNILLCSAPPPIGNSDVHFFLLVITVYILLCLSKVLELGQLSHVTFFSQAASTVELRRWSLYCLLKLCLYIKY